MKSNWIISGIQILVYWQYAITGAWGAAENGTHLAVRPFDGEELVLTLEDGQGRVWRIERSTDLRRWTALQLVRSEQGRVEHRVPLIKQPGSGFFRAIAEMPSPSAIYFAEFCTQSREADTLARIKVLREGNLQSTEQVYFASSEINATAGAGGDYVERAGMLEFAPGVSEQYIEFQLRPDTLPEEDEVFIVTLSTRADQEDLRDATLVAILDDDTPIRTSAACLEFIPEQFSFNSRPLHMVQDQNALYWSEAGESPLRSMSIDGTAPESLAQKMGVLRSLVVRDGFIYRMESRDGASESGCVGFDTHRALVRSRLDGSEPRVLADYDTCLGVPDDLIVDPQDAFVVSSSSSPDLYEILRVPVNGYEPEVLVSTDGRIKSITSDGAYAYWAEEEASLRTSLYRVSRHGGVPERLAGGYADTLSNLAVANGHLYAMTNSLNGLQLVAIDVATFEERVLWESPIGMPMRSLRKLVIRGNYAYWLDDQSIHRLPLVGGPKEVLVGDLVSTGDFWVERGMVFWSETERSGRIMRLDLRDLSKAPIKVSDARLPEALATANGVLYWIEGGILAYPTGFGRIAAKSLLEDSAPTQTAVAGISEDTIPFVLAGDYLYVADQWTIRRVPRQGGNAEIVTVGFFTITTLAVDNEYVYWVDSDPMNIVRKAPLAGGDPVFLGVGTGGPHPHSLQLAGSNLYWVDHDTRIVSMPKTGGSLTVLVNESDFISDMLIQGNDFYYALISSGLLKRMPLTGGTSETFASSQQSIWTRLMATPTHLFRLHQLGLDRIDLASGTTQVLLDQDMEQDLFFAGAVSGGQNRVYWTETLTGKIRFLNY